MPKSAAVYCRVSTDRQTVENQVAEVRQLVLARGYEPVVYEEVESAAKARPVLARMLEDARRGKVQAVAVWALDRLHRSMVGAIQTVLELDRLGVPVLSVREAWLDTSGPVRTLLVAIFGWVAEQERTRLVERINAGLSRVKAEEANPRLRAARRNRSEKEGGPKLAIGRPRKLDEAKVSKVRELRAAGRSWNEIAAAVGVSTWTCMRAAAKAA